MKGIETIEQYLSSIDIALLETPEPSFDSVDNLLTYLGAKDEKEALNVMYHALLLIEVYFNRVIQHVLISLYNSNKGNGEKPVSGYFESELVGVNELIQGYQQLMVNQSKQPIDPSAMARANENYKSLSIENEKLRKKCEELNKKIEALEKDANVVLFPTSVIESKDNDDYIAELKKLEKTVRNLDEKFAKEKQALEESLREISQYKIDVKTLNDVIEEIKSNKNPYL